MKKRTRTGGGGGDDGDGGGGEAAAADGAPAADAAYRAARPAAAGRLPAGIRGSLLRGPSLRTCGSCPPSGSRCL